MGDDIRVRLISTEGKEVLVTLRDMVVSKKIYTELKSKKGTDHKYSIHNGCEETLKKLGEWARRHRNDPPMRKSENIYMEKPTDDITDEDEKFMEDVLQDEKQHILFELLLVAKEQEIEGLLALTCKLIAREINGKTPEQICAKFRLKHNEGFSPAELKEMKEETKWCE